MDQLHIDQLLYICGKKMYMYDNENGQKVMESFKPRITREDFRVDTVLGIGSYSVVKGARTGVFEGYGEVALKMLRVRTDPAVFFRELDFCRKLQHKNIVRCLAAFTDDRPIMVFEKAGGTLWEASRSNYEVICAWFTDCLDGLRFLHNHLTVHNDIKPTNIVICGRSAKLSDLGSCVRLDTSTSKETTLNRHVGTYCYSPLVTLEEKKVSPATDIFMLAATFFEILTKTNFLRPKGTWLSNIARNLCLQEEDYIVNYYITAHKFGRIDDGNHYPSFLPGVDKASIFSKPYICKRSFLNEIVYGANYNEDAEQNHAWKNLMAKMMGYDYSIEKLACIEDVTKQEEYPKIRQSDFLESGIQILRSIPEMPSFGMVPFSSGQLSAITLKYYYESEAVIAPKASSTVQRFLSSNEHEHTKSPTRRKQRVQRPEKTNPKIKKPDGQTVYVCPFQGCGEEFRFACSLSKHKKKIHPINQQLYYACFFCKELFPRMDQFNNHAKVCSCKFEKNEVNETEPKAGPSHKPNLP